MNILEQEDLIKGLPDQVLVEEAQAPTGNVPSIWLSLRFKDERK